MTKTDDTRDMVIRHVPEDLYRRINILASRAGVERNTYRLAILERAVEMAEGSR